MGNAEGLPVPARVRVSRCFSTSHSLSFTMVQVAVGILLIDQKVLLCQRKATARYGLQWEFPGGKVEPGESPEACVCRELFEELSINPYSIEFFHRDQHVYPDAGAFDVFYYKVPSYCGTIVNNCFEAVEWVPLVRLHTFNILEGNRSAISALLSAHAAN